MIINLSDLSKIRGKYKNKTIVLAGGVFDVFHSTHIRALKKLRLYGDIVVIGIVSDKKVRERKGKERPIISQAERCEIVNAVKYVDFVVQMPNPTKLEPYPTITILEKLRPNLFVSVDKRWVNYKNIFNKLGIKIKIVKRIHPTSSTSIIKRILKKYKE